MFATYGEEPIRVGEQVFATYSDFINSCEDYPEDQEDDEDYIPDPWDDYEEDDTTIHEAFMTDVTSVPGFIPVPYEELESLLDNRSEDKTTMHANYMIEQDIPPEADEGIYSQCKNQMQRIMVKRLIELGYTGSNTSNKKPEGCDQQQIKEEPKIEHTKITSEQEKEILKARHNENMKELSERIETWKPFKDEQGPS